MKILIVFRRKEGSDWKSVRDIEKKLIGLGHRVDFLSREDDLNMYSLSNSMGSLSTIIEKKDKENNYRVIYTQNWSIAFPLLVPNKTLFKKHYCLFYDIEPSGAQSKILQKITGNLLGNHLLVKTKGLKEKFPKAIFSPDGISKEVLK